MTSSLAQVQLRVARSTDTCPQTPQNPKSVELMETLPSLQAVSESFQRLTRSFQREHMSPESFAHSRLDKIRSPGSPVRRLGGRRGAQRTSL